MAMAWREGPHCACSIRRPVSAIEVSGGIAQEGVGERDVRRETFGKGYERHG